MSQPGRAKTRCEGIVVPLVLYGCKAYTAKENVLDMKCLRIVCGVTMVD